MKSFVLKKGVLAVVSLSLLVSFNNVALVSGNSSYRVLSTTSYFSQNNQETPKTLDQKITEIKSLLAALNQDFQDKKLNEVISKIPKLKELYGALFETYNDTRGLPEKSLEGWEIEQAKEYINEKLTTDPFVTDFSPSIEKAEKDPVIKLSELDEKARKKYFFKGVETVIKGKGVFGLMAAGASSRMKTDKVPDAVLKMAIPMMTEEPKIESKAAIPIGVHNEKTFSYLGAFLTNIARMQQQISEEINRSVKNKVMILTNDKYRKELNSELAIHSNYGISADDFLIYHQPFGPMFYANLKDIEAYEKAKEKFFPAAKKKAEEILKRLGSGDAKAPFVPNERSPLGHADFLHQMISSGLIKKLIKDEVEWISTRNIDNAAATFDENWLITLGMFMDKKLDMQMEVSPRKAGQKGGGLYVLEDGTQILNEDPAVDASFESFKEKQTKDGFEWVDSFEISDKKITLKDLEKTQGNPGEYENVKRFFTMWLSGLNGGKKAFELLSYHMRSGQDKEISLEKLAEMMANNKALIFKKNGDYYFYEKTTSKDSYWFNDAVAIFNLQYVYSLYFKGNQTHEDFKKEILDASDDQLKAIAQRGRLKFPALIDPKPGEDESMLVIKPETNFWQGTSKADRKKIKMAAVGVESLNDIEQQFKEAVKNGNTEIALKLILCLRMLATKQWDGPVESYQSNTQYVEYILKFIEEKDLINTNWFSVNDIQELQKIKENDIPANQDLSQVVSDVKEFLQQYIQHRLSQEVNSAKVSSENGSLVDTAI